MHIEPKISERSLTIAYVFALGLIALLTTLSAVTLDRMMAEHEGSAAVINISGRQRMLSQRITSLALQYHFNVPGAREDLLAAIDKFEAAHHKLLADLAGPPNGRTPGPAAEELRRINFSGDVPLDGEVAAFIDMARKIATAPNGTAPVVYETLPHLIAEARAPLLNQLDRVVTIHQQDSEAQLMRLEGLQRATLAVVLLTLMIEALLIFRPMVRRIVRYAGELLRLATTDFLTGALNRMSFLERGEIEMARAQRNGRPVSVLMLDADHFKQINDRFGHDAGDEVLRGLAKTLANEIRPTDVLGRLGGEEFAVILPDARLDAAQGLAERLLACVADLRISHGAYVIGLTVSIGVASRSGGSAELTDMLREADQALYAAKSSGRNRVCTASLMLV